MATVTPRLNLPRPEPSDNVNLANHQALIDAIDNAAETPAGAQAKADAAEQAAKAYTDAEVDTRATKTEFNAHVSDNTRHITASERSSWNAKETPAGAQAKVDAHANATSAHGATSAATANRIVMRDGNGRAAVANPVNNNHIANKQYVDDAADAAEQAAKAWAQSFGLGTNSANYRTATDLNQERENGWVKVEPSTANIPSSGFAWGFCRIETRASTAVYQTLYRTDTAHIRIWTRKLSDGAWTPWYELWTEYNLPNPARRDIDNNFISQTISGELRLSGRLASTVLPNNKQIIEQSASRNRIWVGNPETHLRFESDGDIDASITGRGLVTLWHTGNQGNPNNLNTSSKQIVGAINELFTTVSNGKQAIRDAIADAGGTPPSGSPDQYTHQDLANAISTVSKYASGSEPTDNTTSMTIQVRGINFDVDVFTFFYQTNDDGGVRVIFTNPYSPFIRKTNTTAGDPSITPVTGGFDITISRPAGTDFDWEAWGGRS